MNTLWTDKNDRHNFSNSQLKYHCSQLYTRLHKCLKPSQLTQPVAKGLATKANNNEKLYTYCCLFYSEKDSQIGVNRLSIGKAGLYSKEYSYQKMTQKRLASQLNGKGQMKSFQLAIQSFLASFCFNSFRATQSCVQVIEQNFDNDPRQLQTV